MRYGNGHNHEAGEIIELFGLSSWKQAIGAYLSVSRSGWQQSSGAFYGRSG
jgi:hypothetical protein